jgi:superfamily II DNA/RNA helicase
MQGAIISSNDSHGFLLIASRNKTQKTGSHFGVVATDIAQPGNGIKSLNMPLVTNREFPDSAAMYIQRIGRGLDPSVKPSDVVINLVTGDEILFRVILKVSAQTATLPITSACVA